MGVRELAAAMAEPGKIEAQYCNAHPRKACRDATGRGDVLAAGEAVGKQRHGLGRPLGPVVACGQITAVMSGKIQFIADHPAFLMAFRP